MKAIKFVLQMLPFVTLSVTGDGPRAPGLQAGEGGGEGGAREAVHHPGHGQRRDGGDVMIYVCRVVL